MEPPPKNQNVNGDEDRISRLPDPVLHLILSNLETRSALPTKLLSKRWEMLWASMPYFYICAYNRGKETVPYFVRFVESLLRLCDQSDIQSFRMWFDPSRRTSVGGLEQQHLSEWIEQLVGRNVQILEVEALLGEDVELPSCLFTCCKLEELKLAFDEFKAIITTPEAFGVGRLRKMCLKRVTFGCDSLQKIISGCPVLQDLNMSECQLDGLDISSDSLETLTICDCEVTGSMIRIASPKTRHLIFWSNHVSPLEMCLGNLSSLVDATVQVDNCCEFGDEPIPLKFVSPSIENHPGDSALHTFSSLKELTIEGQVMDDCFPAVAYFLDHSPNLEELSLSGAGYDPLQIPCRESNYSCAHIKRRIIFDCGWENDGLIEKMEKYLQSKCYCDSGLIVSSPS